MIQVDLPGWASQPTRPRPCRVPGFGHRGAGRRAAVVDRRDGAARPRPRGRAGWPAATSASCRSPSPGRFQWAGWWIAVVERQRQPARSRTAAAGRRAGVRHPAGRRPQPAGPDTARPGDRGPADQQRLRRRLPRPGAAIRHRRRRSWPAWWSCSPSRRRRSADAAARGRPAHSPVGVSRATATPTAPAPSAPAARTGPATS